MSVVKINIDNTMCVLVKRSNRRFFMKLFLAENSLIIISDMILPCYKKLIKVVTKEV